MYRYVEAVLVAAGPGGDKRALAALADLLIDTAGGGRSDVVDSCFKAGLYKFNVSLP